jgi:hypothetical protein
MKASYVLSILLAFLAVVASVAGLLLDGAYGEPESTAEMLRGYDLVTVAVALPLLCYSLLWARRGSGQAQLIWAGMLAYLAYTYAYYVFGTSFNDLFLLHIAAFGSAVFALVLVLSTVDIGRVARRPVHRTRERLVSILLALLALGLGGMWIYFSLRFSATGDVPLGSALVETVAIVHLGIALDLALLVPAYALAAVLLWRGDVWGYVVAAVVLVSGTLHQVSYMVALPFQAAADVPSAVMFDPAEPAIAAIFVLATALLLWGPGSSRRVPR